MVLFLYVFTWEKIVVSRPLVHIVFGSSLAPFHPGTCWTEKNQYIFLYLKGVWHKIFVFSFFSRISFPWPLSISLRPFQIFTKIRGDIRDFVDSGDKLFTGGVSEGNRYMKKTWSRKSRVRHPLSMHAIQIVLYCTIYQLQYYQNT